MMQFRLFLIGLIARLLMPASAYAGTKLNQLERFGIFAKIARRARAREARQARWLERSAAFDRFIHVSANDSQLQTEHQWKDFVSSISYASRGNSKAIPFPAKEKEQERLAG